ncbi:MAG TPA: glycosyltransferase family 39 protein, partial [Candidatus Glassbacteria bacterium]|nr:glycosyltransferase family 39 protein [Candidatus Glassbacteria bacterium]
LMRSYPLFEPLLPGYDMTVFHECAKRIASGQLIPGQAFYQAPLYPYLLGALYAVTGANVLAAALFQALLGSTSVGLVYLIGNRLWGRATGLVAAGLMAITPIFPFYEVFTLRDTLATFLNLAFLAALNLFDGSKPFRRAALAGVLLGLAALCRANALVLLPAGAWTIWRPPAGWVNSRAIALFLLLTFVTISPATIHNRLAGGHLALVETSFSENWKIGNSYDSTGGFSYPQKGLVPIFSVDFLRLQLQKAQMLVSDYEQPNNLNFYQIAGDRPWLRLIPLSWGFYLAFGLAGILLTRGQRRKLFPLYAYLVLYGGSLIAFFILSRFRLPLWPVLILFSAAGFEKAVRLVREKRLVEPAAVMATAAAAWLFLAASNPR